MGGWQPDSLIRMDQDDLASRQGDGTLFSCPPPPPTPPHPTCCYSCRHAQLASLAPLASRRIKRQQLAAADASRVCLPPPCSIDSCVFIWLLSSILERVAHARRPERMSADKPRLWGSARLPLPYLALLVLFGSIPLAMLLGTLPSSSSTRLLFLERFLADGEVRRSDRRAARWLQRVKHCLPALHHRRR